ncbi:CdiI family contact-dependent growth inhibition immunity protein [Gluconobacter wancherniae]|uniref:contact-dependent growth inhibition system immunity protein n=1 Tax=Gluconobacter wancherniae TaxID=1307955 RepID=UPI001B8D839B|nr:contact-dependent growth inhibition system immunity protein [Gluconobacter wancherniae]MBS1064176.1 CdiI family contact-dependent growth inhibition immunity protein [Gluconobacter wancherniae]
MSESRFTPERIRSLHTKSAEIVLSPKYISITSDEIWGGVYFSRTGWCAHAPGDASPQWIGENFRKALQTSEYFNKPEVPFLDREEIQLMKEASNRRRIAFLDEIVQTYGYKNRDEVVRRCDMVFTSWHYLIEDFVTLIASKRVPGGHSAWGPMDKKKYAETNLIVPLSVSDEELGLAIRDALSRCEAPGRQKINSPPASI